MARCLGTTFRRQLQQNVRARAAAAGSAAGHVVLVTGSTDGIGLHTATRLAQAGTTVLVHGRCDGAADCACLHACCNAATHPPPSPGPRSPQRVEEAVAAVRRASSSSSSAVVGYVADLSSQADVRRLAAEVLRDHGSLDALVNNAGVYEQQKR